MILRYNNKLVCNNNIILTKINTSKFVGKAERVDLQRQQHRFYQPCSHRCSAAEGQKQTVARIGIFRRASILEALSVKADLKDNPKISRV